MGTCGGPMTEEEQMEYQMNRLVNTELAQDRERDEQIKKVILLGSGGSGKSTFFKQLQTLHGSGFSDKDRIPFRNHINHQIIDGMKRIIERALELSNDNPEEFGDCKLSENVMSAAEYIKLLRDDAPINEQTAAQIDLLWKDEGIQRTFSKRALFGIVDSTEYFFNCIDRVSAPNYIPSMEDILLCRHRTIGVSDKTFNIKGTQLRIFDVGGQRAERRKWIHCFEAVTAVIFVVSLSGYNEAMYESEDENVMIDSLELFEKTANNEWFQWTSMILFFNKSDLFLKKIRSIPITECFDEYDGPNTHEDSLKYIQKQFNLKNKAGDKRPLYMHVTCATDKKNVDKVFNDVQHIIVQSGLDDEGIL